MDIASFCVACPSKGDTDVQFRCVFLTIIVLSSLLSASFAQDATVLEYGGVVRTVAFSPVNGFRIAGAGEGNTIKIWDLRNDTVITLEGHAAPINAIAFSPDGRLLVSGGDDHVFKLWDVRHGKNVSTFEHIINRSRSPVKGVTFSPDGQLLASMGHLGVKLWDVDNGVEIATLQHDDWMFKAAFSPNGRFLAAGGAKGEVKVWNVRTQQVIVHLQGDITRTDTVAFSPDGKILATAGYSGRIKLWVVSNWELIGTLNSPVGTVFGLNFSPDGKVLASTGHLAVNLWSVETGEKIAELPGDAGWVRSVGFTPNGNTIASGGDSGTITVQNIKTHLESQHIRNMVRIIYFLPLDRLPQPGIDAQLDAQIKDVQRFYADQMASHGFGRKTFRLETDATGKVVVHHVNGRFTDVYYQDQSTEIIDKVWEEIHERFDRSKHIYLVAIDVGSERIGDNDSDVCGRGGEYFQGGNAIYPASGNCFVDEYGLPFGTAAHELGHAFGLQHDFRNDTYIMSYGGRSQRQLSTCAAEWLDAHRYFNTNLTYFNEPTTFKMLPPRAVPPYSIRLPFQLTDTDGLHQAQLLIPITVGDPDFSINPGGIKLQACQSLNGQNVRTGFVTTQLIATPLTEVTLQVMDAKGDFTRQTFPIDVTDLLPRPEVVSIPDPNLAAAIREALALAPTENITQLDMLGLVGLDANDRQVTRLTGLEHATNLRGLNLRGNQISDISSLTKLIHLTTLSLDDNQIIELPPLAKLTRLAFLTLSNNQITDITALAGLTNLSVLEIDRNQIGNITALVGLTQLNEIWISRNPIRDMSPLHVLIKANPNIDLDIDINQFPEGASKVIVSLPDPNLETVVRETLNLAPANNLTQLDMLRLTRLDASDRKINDLTGIEHATNLTWLNLSQNPILDITLLASLTNLTGLWMYENQSVHDIASLSKLTNLTRLGLSGNQIVDIAPLSGLTNLTSLNFAWNHIRDISPLAGLVNLEELSLDGNHIRDMTPLYALLKQHPDIDLDIDINQFPEGASKVIVSLPDPNLETVVRETLNLAPANNLTQLDMLRLTRLDASDRKINDLTGIEHATNLTWLNLSQNPILDITLLASLTNLTGLWMYENQSVHDIASLSKLTNLTRLGLSGNQIVDIAPLSGLTNLTSLNFAWNHIRDISPLAGLVNLEELSLDGNHIRDMTPLYALLKQHPDIDLDIDISQFPEGIAKVVVSIPDANLAAVVRETLNLTPKDRLTQLDMLWLTGLNASGREIANLTGIEYAKNLKWLWISDNHITDILPLATLVNLDQLSLWRNQIVDVTPLTQLVNLKKLWLAGNPIEDMSPLYALLEKVASINLDISHILYPLDKITGPWLWMIAPTETGRGGADSIDLDSLTLAGSDAVTETDMAVNGAKEGDTIGDYAWTLGEIPEHGSNNVNDLVNKIGFVDGGNPETTADDMDINDHSSYALITLESTTAQSNVTMLAGSDDAIKIWLNGEVAHKNQVNRGANDFQDIFKVDLKAGDNLLMVKVSELTGGWSMFIGIDADVKVKQQFTNTAEKIAAAPSLSELINPAETVLFPNYPNPFNPETWIPYQLAVPADVSISIYAANGQLVRTLSLGYQPVGVYESRSRAAYWDGRNTVGESVASGVYFYALTAGDFTATRKMLILK